MSDRYRCAVCGEWHDGPPLDYAAAAPDPVRAVPPGERAARVRRPGDDFFVLDDKHFFMRGLIEIPVHGIGDTLAYGVWVSLSEESFRRFYDVYDKPDAAGEPPRPGWLMNSLTGYPETYRLKTMAHLRDDAPARIELEPTDHPLAVQQRDGITMDDVRAIASRMLHGT